MVDGWCWYVLDGGKVKNRRTKRAVVVDFYLGRTA